MKNKKSMFFEKKTAQLRKGLENGLLQALPEETTPRKENCARSSPSWLGGSLNNLVLGHWGSWAGSKFCFCCSPTRYEKKVWPLVCFIENVRRDATRSKVGRGGTRDEDYKPNNHGGPGFFQTLPIFCLEQHTV